MHVSRRIAGLLAVGALSCAGCASLNTLLTGDFMPSAPPAAADPSTKPAAAKPQQDREPSGDKAAPGEAIDKAAAAGMSDAKPQGIDPSPSPAHKLADPKALAAVIAELQTLGAIDREAQDRLMDDLKNTDPALWPQLLEYFRASLAYRNRPATRPAAEPLKPEIEPEVPHEPTSDGVVVSDRRERSTSRSAEQQTKRLSATKIAASPPIELTPVAIQTTVKAASAAVPAMPKALISTSEQPTNSRPHSSQNDESASSTSANTAEANQAIAKNPEGPDAWRGHLQKSIESLEHETGAAPQTTGEISRHASLRMLYLLDGRREDALRPISGAPPVQQDFWSKELYGLSAYLDTERNADTARRAAEAGVHLREATAKLGELATLQVKNMAFCSEVHSYGMYKKFEKYDFHAGQELLLYAEVENFKSEHTDKGFHTALKASYQILDTQGARVDAQEFQVTTEHCQNQRRDFFVRYFVYLPKRSYAGKYTLQLTIEDAKSQKIGQSSLEFAIKDAKDK